MANYPEASSIPRTRLTSSLELVQNVPAHSTLHADINHRTQHLAPRQVVTQILHSVRENRPSTTTKTYAVEQRRFLEWCQNDSRFTGPSTCTVDEEKLLVYIWKEVIGRTNSVRSVPGQRVTVGIATVKLAITAIKDIWRQQCADNINSNPNPRGDRVLALVKYVQECEHRRNVEENADRARGTQSDGYTSTKEMESIANTFLKGGATSDCSWRNRAMFLVQHYGVLRGQTARQFDFADLQCRKFNVNAPTDCIALVLITKRSKTNHVNRIEEIGILRAKEPEVCAVGALALYFFARYHCCTNKFPSLSDRRNWYQVKVRFTFQS